MSLAVEWKRASRPDWTPGTTPGERRGRDLSLMAERSRRFRILSRIFFISMSAVLLAITVLFAALLVQDLASRREIRAREMEKLIQQEKIRQEELRAAIAEAESVRELERVAEEVLGMVKGTDPVRVKSEEPGERDALLGEATAGR
ncbi:MAG: hypothetical protein WHT46_07710 [Candidatus Geothermincolales bacterium]